jgi:hypothetical protein
LGYFGVLEFWSFGVLEFWSFGVLEFWSFGVLGVLGVLKYLGVFYCLTH